MAVNLKYIFVLMLENRSFDHMFGFSGLNGTDAATGVPTSILGLGGHESNTVRGVSYLVERGADYVMPTDPGHEFLNVLDQLCGPAAHYTAGGAYPPIDLSGFVDSYDKSGGTANLTEVMKCFDTPRQLPVVYTLAQEFALCDQWYASMPGPTWPNRMFAHAGSSGGLDHSPTKPEIFEWESVDGFQFPHGSIYDLLKKGGISYRFYAGDDFPMVAALKGVTLFDIRSLSSLKSDLTTGTFPYNYVFIEPSYDVFGDYRNGTCQHPLADVRSGEGLIAEVYEAIRNSPLWNDSLLIVTWDEHGGFFDHLPPPPATPPADTLANSRYTQYGFTFSQYGPRVPALVISPFIPRNTIDHRVYDHASIPASISVLHSLPHLTNRDASARNVLPLLSLDVARTDCPSALPSPVAAPPLAALATSALGASGRPARADDSVNGSNLPAILQSAVRQDLLASPGDKAAILDRVARIGTRQDAMDYMNAVRAKLRSVRH
jgi:phospholipase C